MLVNIILDMSLAYGLTIRPRANTIIDTVTYLVDGTFDLDYCIDGGFGTWVMADGRGGSDRGSPAAPAARGRHGPRRRVVVLSTRAYILHIHTRPTVAWGPPPGAVGTRIVSNVNNALAFAVTPDLATPVARELCLVKGLTRLRNQITSQ